MARIRKLEARNFRNIKHLDWFPSAGINCLIGAGDSGKSTILDAINLCMGARRTVRINDTDFHRLDVSQPISISITLGGLPDSLKNIDVYGEFLRSFDSNTKEISEEPSHGLETVLTINLTVNADLEPIWTLESAQAHEQGLERSLRWADRIEVAPARLGHYLNSQLGWSRGSVLTKLSDDPVELGPKLAEAARSARESFGQAVSEPLGQVLQKVNTTAQNLGVPIGGEAQALLDAHSLSIGDGAVTLHDSEGIPLSSLGTGSSRLLVAGLQREASNGAGIVMVDEVELGLEPHRIQRLLMSLGAKEHAPPLQVFMTTHSPVAVRELNAEQLWVVRPASDRHNVLWTGEHDEAQATARSTPEALLAKTVILCEGESEVGLVRGLDIYWSEQGHQSLFASGAAAESVGGSHPEKPFKRGIALCRLGYRTIVLVDSDKPIDAATIHEFTQAGGRYVKWQEARATEHELFLSLPDGAVAKLLSKAISRHGRQSITDQINARSQGKITLDSIEQEAKAGTIATASRELLGETAHKKAWFKHLGTYEGIAREIVGPNYESCTSDFRERFGKIFKWAHEH